MRNVIHIAYQPIAELGRPIIHLDEQQATHFWQHLHEIIRYQRTHHRYLHEVLRTLFTQFILNLMDAMAENIGSGQVSERTTEQFIAFMRLLNAHFIEHHDIGFYAECLCFSDQSSFGRFFTRMKGMTPKRYRMEK